MAETILAVMLAVLILTALVAFFGILFLFHLILTLRRMMRRK